MSNGYERLFGSLQDFGLRVLPINAEAAYRVLGEEKIRHWAGAFSILEENFSILTEKKGDKVLGNVSAVVAYDLDDSELSKLNAIISFKGGTEIIPEDIWKRIEQSYRENRPQYQFRYSSDQRVFNAARGNALFVGCFQDFKHSNGQAFYWESQADVMEMDSESFKEHYKLLGEVLESTLTAIFPSFGKEAPNRRLRFGLDL